MAHPVGLGLFIAMLIGLRELTYVTLTAKSTHVDYVLGLWLSWLRRKSNKLLRRIL